MEAIISVVVISSSSSSAPRKPKHDSKWYEMIKRRNAFKRKKKTPVVCFERDTTLEASHGLSWVRVCLLGKGGFGSVFYAKTRTTINQGTHLPPQMAVKSATMDQSSSLKHEKQVLCDLTSSPYVVRCYGDEVTHMANGVKIHCRGYIHCDIKPDNILLVPGNGERKGTFVAKLADFGLAEAVNEELHDLRGTTRYMSPELVREKKIGYATDIWAFGCAVLEMLTGKPAWEYSEVEDLLWVIGYTDELPQIPSNVSEDAKDFLSRCFVRTAAHRWSADCLLEHPFLSVN
ncbi:mitogen-activated protein kinase kinase kinase 20 [Hevea brasiliensis]|uniref:mitogen-activated protein kinase kinase kinase 20 n=1 Tax=Hevea brasiliensis TaxID=3981 RepID=UPI0025CFEC7A|nr:mitogen-activated protein kinase kinase kinase 20 [Hevea brasiliensis]